MAEIVVGRWRPTPGQDTANFEIPGPGLYEADFSVPGWLIPDFVSARTLRVPLGEMVITHLRSSESGGVLTVRFRVERDPVRKQNPSVEFSPLVVGVIISAIAGAIGGSFITGQLAKFLTELRRIAETPLGVGLGALALVGAGILAYG